MEDVARHLNYVSESKFLFYLFYFTLFTLLYFILFYFLAGGNQLLIKSFIIPAIKNIASILDFCIPTYSSRGLLYASNILSNDEYLNSLPKK